MARPQAAITPDRHYPGSFVETGLVLASQWTQHGELLVVLRNHHIGGRPYSVIFCGEETHWRTLAEAATHARI